MRFMRPNDFEPSLTKHIINHSNTDGLAHSLTAFVRRDATQLVKPDKIMRIYLCWQRSTGSQSGALAIWNQSMPTNSRLLILT